MSTDFGEPFDSLKDGQTHTVADVDWDVVAELLDIDFEEHDEYDYYITDRTHPLVFIKGDVKIDGNCHTDDLATRPAGVAEDHDEWGVVVLGNLEVTGNLSLDELSPLFVTGNLKAGAITNAYGSLVVTGTIETGFVYLITADEGGIVHATECKSPLFIDAGGSVDSYAPGDYLHLMANNYNPREDAVLRRALTELGFDPTGLTVTQAVKHLGNTGDPAKISRFVELVETFLDTKPDTVPDDAVWDDVSSSYVLEQTDDDGTAHGLKGQWGADGKVEFVERYRHGTPHGEWTIEANSRQYSLTYENGELQRPDGVPEGAVWLPEESEWELSNTDDDGKKHGEVKWWRPDGTLVCEANYVHGLAQGPGRRFHESGEISQTYQFVDNQLHGERTFFATDKHTTEHPLGDGIAKAVYLYDMGTTSQVKFYNQDGVEVNRWGQPM